MEGFATLETGIGSLIALVVGYFLKKNPGFSNKLIPWVTVVISVLTQIVNELTPAAHAAASSAALLSVGAITLNGVLMFALKVALQTVGVTGTHSFAKNTKELLKA